jgi:prepilin-type N-terminal cleavage/methylation domain-containing protein
MKNKKGFSMPELLIAIILIGIISIFAIPNLTKGQGRRNIRDIARQITRDYNLIRNIAMRENLATRMEVLAGPPGEYNLYKYDPANLGSPWVLINTYAPANRNIGTTVRFAGDVLFAIDSRGMAVDSATMQIAGSFVITLTTGGAAGTDRYTLTIYPSGVINVQKELDT